jgi:hypothetical protein
VTAEHNVAGNVVANVPADLLERLLQAANRNVQPAAGEPHAIVPLIEQGCDLDLDVLPAVHDLTHCVSSSAARATAFALASSACSRASADPAEATARSAEFELEIFRRAHRHHRPRGFSKGRRCGESRLICLTASEKRAAASLGRRTFWATANTRSATRPSGDLWKLHDRSATEYRRHPLFMKLVLWHILAIF